MPPVRLALTLVPLGAGVGTQAQAHAQQAQAQQAQRGNQLWYQAYEAGVRRCTLGGRPNGLGIQF